MRVRGALLPTAGAALWAARAVFAAMRPAPDRLRRDLAAILARPEYQEIEDSWLRQVLTRWFRRLWEWLTGWSPRVERLKEAWPVLYWVIVATLVILLALLLFHIGLTFSMAFRERRRPEKAKGPGPTTDPSVLRARASELAARGQYAEAIQLLYEALLRFLDRQDVVRYDSACTNWEYAERVPGPGPLRVELAGLAPRLDGLLYGGRPADAQEFGLCAAMVERAWAAGEAGE